MGEVTGDVGGRSRLILSGRAVLEDDDDDDEDGVDVWFLFFSAPWNLLAICETSPSLIRLPTMGGPSGTETLLCFICGTM